MNIELRNVKHAAFASRETACFTATIYIDGKQEGTVENSGHGGPHNIHPHQLEQRIDAYAKTLPEVDVSYLYKDGKKHTLPMSGDLLIGELLEDVLAERHLKRLMKHSLLYTKAGTKGIWQTTKLAPDVLARKVAEARALVEAGKPLPDAERCLNVMPMAEAVKLYREVAR